MRLYRVYPIPDFTARASDPAAWVYSRKKTRYNKRTEKQLGLKRWAQNVIKCWAGIRDSAVTLWLKRNSKKLRNPKEESLQYCARAGSHRNGEDTKGKKKNGVGVGYRVVSFTLEQRNKWRFVKHLDLNRQAEESCSNDQLSNFISYFPCGAAAKRGTWPLHFWGF